MNGRAAGVEPGSRRDRPDRLRRRDTRLPPRPGAAATPSGWLNRLGLEKLCLRGPERVLDGVQAPPPRTPSSAAERGSGVRPLAAPQRSRSRKQLRAEQALSQLRRASRFRARAGRRLRPETEAVRAARHPAVEQHQTAAAVSLRARAGVTPPAFARSRCMLLRRRGPRHDSTRAVRQRESRDDAARRV